MSPAAPFSMAPPAAAECRLRGLSHSTRSFKGDSRCCTGHFGRPRWQELSSPFQRWVSLKRPPLGRRPASQGQRRALPARLPACPAYWARRRSTVALAIPPLERAASSRSCPRHPRFPRRRPCLRRRQSLRRRLSRQRPLCPPGRRWAARPRARTARLSAKSPLRPRR
jgi:hypothetical protein